MNKIYALYAVIFCMIVGIVSVITTKSVDSTPRLNKSSSQPNRVTHDTQALSTAPPWGQHIILGYTDVEEIIPLIKRGAIGGVFLNQINTENRSVASLSAEIARFQEAAQSVGLPPLFIAADQEGGVVERLSPPLTSHPSLASVIRNTDPEQWQEVVSVYAASQAAGLNSVGLNLNLSPVVDLEPQGKIMQARDESRLEARAIASDSATVSRVAQIYTSVMLDHNIIPTLKHFPGLGATSMDTHQGPVHLDASYEDMWYQHLMPYQEVIHDDMALMLSHITWDTIDPNHAVSHSASIIQNYVREGLHFNGLVITDDLSMKAITESDRGIEEVALESLNAGVDLLLISSRPELFNIVAERFDEAVKAGEFNRSRLKSSQQRLARYHNSL